MPTITLNKKIFEGLVGKKLPLDKLKDRISYLGTDLEKIEGNEIHVEVFPNRPDMLSEQGFARAFSSFIGVKTGLRLYKVEESNEKVIIDKSVAKVRPYTACAIVKNLCFNNEKIKEVIDIQEKLHITYGRNRKKVAIGIYPYERIKTPIRYVAKNPEEIIFQPLEFTRKINGRQILSLHSAGKEYGHLLKGLDKFPIFTDADDEILSMPPIINSHKTGRITEKTKDVFIECSGFDFYALNYCLNIIVTALSEMGGKIYSMKLIYPNEKIITPNLEPRQMKLNINYANKLLGLRLKEKDIKKYLERMGFGYKNKKVLVPAYRTDILHQLDLVEDIAIAYGYDNFEAKIPKVATIAEEDKFEIFKNKVTQILIGFGLIEVNNYHLINKKDQTKNMNCHIEVIEVDNPKTLEYNTLRSWIIPCLMKNLKENKHYDYPQNIFEIGTVFKKDSTQETNIKEFTRVAVLLSHNKAGYTEVRQVLDALFRTLDLKYEIKETEHNSFIPGRVGRVIVNSKKIAYIGEIHPICLENFELEMPTSGFELNLSELFEIIGKS
jgi:phenylalanyl-tRNA synthetase beta chain